MLKGCLLLSLTLQVIRDLSVLQGLCSPSVFVPSHPLLVSAGPATEARAASRSFPLTPPTSTFYGTFQQRLPELASLPSQLLQGLPPDCCSFERLLLWLPHSTPFSHALPLLSWICIFIFLPMSAKAGYRGRPAEGKEHQSCTGRQVSILGFASDV